MEAFNWTELSVLASFPVHATWIIPHPANRIEPATLRNGQRLSVGDLFHSSPPALKDWGKENHRMVFRPMVSQDAKFPLLRCEIGLEFEDKFLPRDANDVDAVRLAVKKLGAAHFVAFSNGDMSVIFAKTIELHPCWQWARTKAEQVARERKCSPGKDKLLSWARHAWNSNLEKIVHVTHKAKESSVKVFSGANYATLRLSEPRFEKQLVINFSLAESLEPGQVLNPSYCLTMAQDPWLPSKHDGTPNCLTDFRNISIPLVRPSEDAEDRRLRWDYALFENIQCLRAIPESSWLPFLRFLQGKKVTSFEDFVSEKVIVQELDACCKRCDGRCANEKDGQCYDGAYKSLSVVGPYLIFEVVENAETFFIVDSPLYGVALRVFRKREHAVKWAMGGQSRKEVDNNPEALVKRFCHDPKGQWRKSLARVFEYVESAVT